MALPKSQFRPKYRREVDIYLKKKQDEVVTYYKEETVDKGGTITRKKGGVKIKVNLPTIKDFAVNHLKVPYTTMHQWSLTDDKFANALEKIKAEQMQRLIDYGLSGDYNPVIAKLILINNHDMKDKTDITTDDESLNTFNDEQISRIAGRIARGQATTGSSTSQKKSN